MEEYKVPKSSWFFIGICKINTHVPTLESSKALHGYNSKEAAKEEIAYEVQENKRVLKTRVSPLLFYHLSSVPSTDRVEEE